MMSSRGKTVWLVLAVLSLLSFPANSRAQFWKKKDFHHWSAKECEKILTNSPWAKYRSFSSVQMPNGAQDTQAAVAPYGITPSETPAAPGRQALTEIKYTAQFFSALPVREAQVRLAQIQSHYDKMPAAQKRAFDANAARFLAVRYPEDTVIRVTFSTNVGYFRAALENTWSLENTAKLEKSSYLTVDGKTVPLARYQFGPQRSTFYLFFPRQVNGEPLLNPSRVSLTLQVTKSTLPFVNGFGSENAAAPPQPPPAGNVEFEFNVKKMIYQGTVAY